MKNNQENQSNHELKTSQTSQNFTKSSGKSIVLSFEFKALIILTALLCLFLAGTWFYSMQLKKNISVKKSAVKVDVEALIDVEKMRNTIESQIDSSLLYFTLGSQSLYDEQRKNKDDFAAALNIFEKKYQLPNLHEISKNLREQQGKISEYFEQGIDFRNKKTESKIVGQFFRSKTAPIKTAVNKELDRIIELHNSEVSRGEKYVREAAAEAEDQIPRGMTYLTVAMLSLFFCMALLLIKVLFERPRHIAERTRLYKEAQKAIDSRNAVISAVAVDFKEPLQEIVSATKKLPDLTEKSAREDLAELIKSSAFTIEDRVQNILDQEKSTENRLVIRLEQRGVDAILEDARLAMQSVAKAKDIRLEFAPINHSVLAFVDNERIMRVFYELVGNAIKFSPRNNKVIVKSKTDSQFVHIAIRDFGSGIPEAQLKTIFDNYWQARKTSDQGAGVGLAAIKTIIEAHGGTITVESHVGHGSTFTFSLPRRRPTSMQLGKSTAPSRQSTQPMALPVNVTSNTMASGSSGPVAENSMPNIL